MRRIEDRIEADLALGVGDELIPELEALVAEHPFRETFAPSSCSRSTALAGKRTLWRHRAARRRLVDELGLEPSEELRNSSGGCSRTIRRSPARDSRPTMSFAESSRRARRFRRGRAHAAGGAEVRHRRRRRDRQWNPKGERLDPEDVRALIAPYHARIRSELERYGGSVERSIGGTAVALFGAPAVHEDDPERAVRAALAIRQILPEGASRRYRCRDRRGARHARRRPASG